MHRTPHSYTVMPTTHKDRVEYVLRQVLPSLIRDLGARSDPLGAEPQELYSGALRMVVRALLPVLDDSGGLPKGTSPQVRLRLNDLRVLMRPARPAEVGCLYESLRGFRVEFPAHGPPKIVASMRGRRNQGLFYTPRTVVEHIVSRTLTPVEAALGGDLTDVRILDPAVGTGAFLVAALEHLRERILAKKRQGCSRTVGRVKDITEQTQQRACDHGLLPLVDERAAVAVHLIENCLFGVDLDPIAVEIARADLLVHAFAATPIVPGIETRLRAGNSLVGEAGTTSLCRSEHALDEKHAALYFGKDAGPQAVTRIKEEKGAFHWPCAVPKVINQGGFHAVVGNPPYEILSVKESGIEERRREQRYFRRLYTTCRGKINTYRLMLERALTLLRPGGVLGFIVPATLLADSTAEELRRMLLDGTEIIETVVIPEKARVFDGVTQALLILITRKGGRSEAIEPVVWNGTPPIGAAVGYRVSRELIKRLDNRIPLLRSWEEQALLETVMRHPPLKGGNGVEPVARIHQGEINLTTHKEYLRSEPTRYPLVRGEHVMPFHLVHPLRPGRLDWIEPSYMTEKGRGCLESPVAETGLTAATRKSRGRVWKCGRIVVGRVVNMATERRLKAAPVPPGTSLGDMTNSLSDLSVAESYVLGLLNSRLLNWRFKLTSTNNYLSAAEIEVLPIPRESVGGGESCYGTSFPVGWAEVLRSPSDSLHCNLRALGELLGSEVGVRDFSRCSRMLESVVAEILESFRSDGADDSRRGRLVALLDAVVLRLYGAEAHVGVLEQG